MTLRLAALGLSLAAAIPLVLPGAAMAQGAPRGGAATLRPGVNPDRPDQAPAGVRQRGGGYRAPPRSSAPRLANPFMLRSVVIEGSSLPPQMLQAGYAPFVGQTIDAAALQKITDAMAAIYERSDIALYSVLVPTQTYEGGVLRLRAVEGFVQAAVVKGGIDPKTKQLIGAYLGPIAAERPLKKATLQRYISLIRDIPGFSTEIAFEPGEQPAAVRLTVDGKARRFQAAVGVNNRGTAFLGKTQGQVDLQANGLVRGGDQARFSYAQPVGGSQYRSFNVAYATPLNANGLTAQVNAGKLTTRPKAFPLRGEATSGGVQLSYPVIRSFERNLVVSGGLDGVNSDNAFLGFTFSSERTRAARLAANYSLQSDRSLTSVSATASAGIPGLGARLLDPTISQRDFRKLNLRASDSRMIGKSLVLRTAAVAQATSDRLPGTEQLAAGGDEFGRAYETAIISGDRGLAASAELAWRPQTLPERIKGSEAYVFADGARLRYLGRNGFDDSTSKLGSVGAGTRVVLAKKTVGQFEAVRGLNNPVFYENREVWRVTFSVRTLFN